MKNVIFSLLLGASFQTKSAAPNFNFFCSDLLQETPALSNYSDYFTEEFQKAVPLPYLKSTFSNLYAQVGSCISYNLIPKGNGQYRLVLHGNKQLDALFSIYFDESAGLFSGLLLDGVDDPSIQIKSWQDVKAAFAKIDTEGAFSATLTTADDTLKLTHNPSSPFAVGSTFKLYVLGALEQAISKGQHQWEEVLPLKEEWKSLPSGIMHTWPAGQDVKLSEYAEKMISVSDNTATDHLVYFLGRENIEKMLVPMGNSHQNSYLPFLTTLEMFKLKWAISPSDTLAYIQKSKEERLKALEILKQVPRSQVGTNFVDMSQPSHIDTLEWFATTPENCQAMFWLASKNSPQIRSILSRNVPVLSGAGLENSHWSYAGYKGGSEPGVLSMTFLLESKKGSRACLSLSWNNPKTPTPRNSLMDVVKKTLEFAETKVP